jgi:hypothetical protein
MNMLKPSHTLTLPLLHIYTHTLPLTHKHNESHKDHSVEFVLALRRYSFFILHFLVLTHCQLI